MSSIDPVLSQPRATSVSPGAETPQLDPATLLLALSLSQMSVLQESLLARVPSLKDQYDTLGRIGSTSAKLSQLHDTVLADETRDARDLLDQLDAFKTKHVTGDENKLIVNDSEQQELANALEWAQQRGFAGPELTKQVPVPKPPESETDKPADGTAAVEEQPVEMQTVVDEQALLEFRNSLTKYLASLKTGDVDNPAIRHRLTSHSDYESLTSAVRSLGINPDLDSPEKLRAAVAELETQFNQVLKAAQQTASEAKLLVGEMGKSTADLSKLNHSQNQIDTRATDRKYDEERERLQGLELDQSREQRLDQLLEVLQSAETALDQLAIRDGAAKELFRELPVSAQLEVQSQMSSWQQNLGKQLESLQQAPRPEHRLRPASTYV